MSPCTCASRWANVACTCSWRRHLTQSIVVECGWLYDDGTDTHDATLRGEVSSDGDVETMALTIDATGEEMELTGRDLKAAESAMIEASHVR